MAVWESWLQDNPVPIESIYYWMYDAGLRGFPEQELELVLRSHGKQIRRKDWENYQRGYQKSYFVNDPSMGLLLDTSIRPKTIDFTTTKLSQFSRSANLFNYERRWVPCSKNNKPLVQWSQNLMDYEDAMVFPESKYIAECMLNTPYIVFDIDGDHNDVLHLGLIQHFYPLTKITHTLAKPSYVQGMPTSFHLTFKTDRLIPTKHFTEVCIDLLGNRTPQLRYRKNKQWNHVFPALLTEDIWRYFMDYIAMKRQAV